MWHCIVKCWQKLEESRYSSYRDFGFENVHLPMFVCGGVLHTYYSAWDTTVTLVSYEHGWNNFNFLSRHKF